MFIDGSKFCEQYLQRVTQGTFLWNYFKIWPAVLEKKVFEEFLQVCIVQKAPIHQSHVYKQIKILQTIFEKGHQRNIPMKLFRNLTSSFGEKDFFKNFFMSTECKKPPFTRALFMDRSKFRIHFLKRGTQGTFLWNYFKIGQAVSEKKIF